jgi:nucleoside-diphosphate-sugar epimerase
MRPMVVSGSSKLLHRRPAPRQDRALRAQRFPYRAQAASPADFRYSYEKILVEESFGTHSPVPVTVLRLPMVYGPGDAQERASGRSTAACVAPRDPLGSTLRKRRGVAPGGT